VSFKTLPEKVGAGKKNRRPPVPAQRLQGCRVGHPHPCGRPFHYLGRL